MWIGIVVALLLCLATAVCYAEMAKLYPGTGSSYYFAEQAFLNHDGAWRYARLSKFIVGWGSHLYYWIYPGRHGRDHGILCGYLVGTFGPNFMSASNPGPLFMMLVAVVFSFADRLYRPSRHHRRDLGQHGDQRHSDHRSDRLLGDGARLPHQPRAGQRWLINSIRPPGEAYNYEFATTSATANGVTTDTIVRDASGVPQPKLDAAGKPVPYHISYPTTDDKGNFLSHPTAGSVVGIHNLAGLHPGHGSDSDPGRLRVGDRDGRRGQECQSATCRSP